MEILAVSLALLLPTTQTGASPKKDFFLRAAQLQVVIIDTDYMTLFPRKLSLC